MRKLGLLFLIFFVLSGAYSLYFMHIQLPVLAQKQTQKTLMSMGFEATSLSEPDIRLTAARFKDITLDKEGISTIKFIEIHYTPFSLLITHQPSIVKIKGLNLTGELSNDGALSIAGWDAQNAKFNLQNGELRTLSLEKSRLSLLTENIGGLNVDFDIQTRTRGTQVTIQGQAKSKQKHLSVISSINGFINQDGVWQAEFDISQGKLELAPIKATRINGTFKVSSQPGTTPLINAQLQAGGLRLYGYPWHNASGSFEGSRGNFTVFADMKSVGLDGLELGLNVVKQGHEQPPKISGIFHAEDLVSALQYLKQHDSLFFDDQTLQTFEGMKNISLEFAHNHESPTSFKLSNDTQSLSISGEAQIKDSAIQSLTLTSQSLFLKNIEAWLRPEKQSFTDGQIKISGYLERKNGDLSGNLKGDIFKGTLTQPPLKLVDITGAITLSDPSALSVEARQTLNCALPLKKRIKQHCELSVSVKNGAVNVEKIETQIFDGQAKLDGYIFGRSGQALKVTAQNIDLKLLSQALDIEGLTMDGRMKAEVPLYEESGQLFIRGGVLRNEGQGTLRYSYDKTPSFFKGDEFELATMKHTLESLNYDFLEIKLSGPLSSPEASIFIRGKNPGSLGGRPISLKFKTHAQSAALFSHILSAKTDGRSAP